MPRKKKQEQLELAVQADKQQDSPAPSSDSSRSQKKNAKVAPTTSKSNKQTAIYIIRKYVLPSKINWSRDITIAYRLIKKCPDIEFWKLLPVKRQVDSLLILAGEKSKKKLGYEYAAYEKRKLIQKNIVIEPVRVFEVGEKVGEPYVAPPKKPKSILEFCR